MESFVLSSSLFMLKQQKLKYNQKTYTQDSSTPTTFKTLLHMHLKTSHQNYKLEVDDDDSMTTKTTASKA